MLLFIAGLVLGVLVGGFVVLNNKNKALAILQAAKVKAEAELAKAKK